MIMTAIEPVITFNKKLFSSVYFRIRGALTRFVIIYGGASASKSYSLMQHIIIDSFETPGNWLVVRKYNVDLVNSVYDNLVAIISGWGLTNEFQFRVSPLGIVNKVTGNKILFKGLDDVEKIKSIYGIKKIFIEEANQLEFDDFRELNRRARGQEGIQIYLVFNPVVINHWLKKELFDNEFYAPHTTKIHATYKDAIKWLTEDDILQLEILKDINPNDYKIYCLGEWGGVRTGNEFYYNFVYTKHIGDCKPIKDIPLHITLDFNVVPYITMEVAQIYEKEDIYRVNYIDEFCLKNPLNNTESLCRKFAEKYEDILNTGIGLYYYGDATGRARDTRGKENDYDIVERVLGKWLSNTSCRVPYNNPLIRKRRDFVNRILSNKYNIRLLIDPACQNLITDCEMVQEDAEGKKFKKKKSDHGGSSYEEYGHCFTGDTIVDGQKKIKDFKIGDITEFGKVLNVWDNGIQEVRTYDIEGVKIRCTPSHKIVVYKMFGFTDRIDYLCMEKLANNHHYVVTKQNGEWKKNQLFIKDLNSRAIQTLKDWQTKDITTVTLKSMENGLKNVFMSLFGSGIMVKFLPSIMFIILMVTLLIMNLITWGAFRASIIFQIMVKMLQMKLKKNGWNIWVKQGLKQPNGMEVKLAGNGIKNTGTIQSDLADLKEKINQRSIPAKSAEKNMRQKSYDHIFVQQGAKIDIVRLKQDIDIKLRNQRFVKFVSRNLLHFQRMLADFAVKSVIKTHAKVYDLEIEGKHVYNANGLLVHNCSDAGLDYLLMSAFEGYIDLIL